MNDTRIGGSKSDLRQTLMGIRTRVRECILERWPDADIVFTNQTPACGWSNHQWRLWRSVRDNDREVNIDCCDGCRNVRVQNSGRQRSESSRSIYVRRTLFYATTERRPPSR